MITYPLSASSIPHRSRVYEYSLIAPRKQMGYKGKRNTPELHTLKFLEVRTRNFIFLGSFVF
jgi:hypothetical protein